MSLEMTLSGNDMHYRHALPTCTTSVDLGRFLEAAILACKVNIQYSIFNIQYSIFKMQASRFKIQDSRFKIQDSIFQEGQGSSKPVNLGSPVYQPV